MVRHRAAALLLVLLAPVGFSCAQTSADLPGVTVWADRLGTEARPVIAAATLGTDALEALRAGESDAARLLDGLAGVSRYSAGGVSSLPVLDGLADDRVRILVDGVPVTASCPNHMNPSLSYVAPGAIQRISVLAGLTPVSLGGDSIGGTIAVRSVDPTFAPAGAYSLDGTASVFSRSVDRAIGGDGRLQLASERAAFALFGSSVTADDYRDGDGRIVRSTEFRSRSGQLALAVRDGWQLLEINAGWQDIPYQGFPNQYMDMTGNTSVAFALQYRADVGWGVLEARAYRRHTWHSMDALSDKAELGVLTTGMPYAMPVDTNGVDAGGTLQANVRATTRDVLRLGAEYHRYALTEIWPPLPGSMMNGPDPFIDINGGSRERLAGFAEWEARWDPRIASQIGARLERVAMDTGPVHGYFSTGESMFGLGLADGSVYAADAAAFNAAAHARTDHNVDATAALRFDATPDSSYELGIGRKTRSPNLYERYAWSNAAGMAGTMVSWFGDLNAYVGNLDLRPEVASTLRADAEWRGSGLWQLSLAPYYTRVHDFISVESDANLTWPAPSGRVALRFVNHAAELYGVDASAHMELGRSSGAWTLKAIASLLRGRDLDAGTDLYNQMPPTARFWLEHRSGGWSGALDLQLVAAKTRVDSLRQELPTGGYALLGLGVRHEGRSNWIAVRADNLLARSYALPLGGVDFYTYNNLAAAGDRVAPVPGAGRSLSLAAGTRF